MLAAALLTAGASLATASPQSHKTLLVVGDSWGSFGPSWHSFQDMFDRHGVNATVKSAARGGTTACQWAQKDTILVEAAEKLFPGLADGPDYMWYSLGGNDLVDKPYVECSKKATSPGDQLRCLDGINAVINKCTDRILEAYWAKFPKSVVVQCGYDFPCEAGKCIPQPRNVYCGTNVTCMNEGSVYFQHIQVDARTKRYPPTQYRGLNVLGAVQAAGKVHGAAVGKPNMTVGSPCDLMAECVHPAYNHSGAVAIAEAFWDLYFKNATQLLD